MRNREDLEYDQVMRFVNSQANTAPTASPDGAIIPPALYLPLHVAPDGHQLVDIRELPDGKRALVAFTALDRLATSCGTEQPWQLVLLDGLADIKDAQPFDVVAFDPNFADHLKRDGRLL